MARMGKKNTHVQEASEWLQKRKKSLVSELIWSINHSHKHRDRVGKANVAGFEGMSHDELTSPQLFELEKNNKCHACGWLWCRDLRIPMGSFSAQSADLHASRELQLTCPWRTAING